MTASQQTEECSWHSCSAKLTLATKELPEAQAIVDGRIPVPGFVFNCKIFDFHDRGFVFNRESKEVGLWMVDTQSLVAQYHGLAIVKWKWESFGFHVATKEVQEAYEKHLADMVVGTFDAE